MDSKGKMNKYIYLNWGCTGKATYTALKIEDSYIKLQRSFNLLPLQSLTELEVACNRSFSALSNFLNCNESSIIFSTGSTHALQNFFQYNKLPAKLNTITTNIEFPAVLNTLKIHSHKLSLINLATNFNKENLISNIIDRINPKTNLFLISQIAYRTGEILPVQDIIKTIRKKYPNIFIIIDGSQAIGQIPVNITELNADLYFFSTDKWLNGPSVGVSVFNNQELKSFFLNYTPSPFAVCKKYRKGKHSKSGVNAAAAAAINSVNFKQYVQLEKDRKRISNLRHLFIKDLQQNLFNLVISDPVLEVSGIVSIEVQAITKHEIEKLYNFLLRRGVIFSLVDYAYPRGINIPQKNIFRFSIHSSTTTKEIKQAAYIIANKLKKYKVKLL